MIRRRLAQFRLEDMILKRDKKTRPTPPPITPSAASNNSYEPPSTPSPRNVSFRDPLRSPLDSHRDEDEIGDRAGTPPSALPHVETARERRERRAEKEREKEREKEEKKERERAERLALTDRLSLPPSLCSIPLPPRYIFL